MAKTKKFDEYDFLNLFYEEMLAQGQAYNLIRLSANARMVENIYEKMGILITENELQQVADICLANSWVQHTVMGVGKYGYLQLTSTGFGVAKSKKMQSEILSKKSFFRKTSDYIVEHKGWFIFLGFIVAVLGLIIKYNGTTGNE
jgi:hypothetical protein